MSFRTSSPNSSIGLIMRGDLRGADFFRTPRVWVDFRVWSVGQTGVTCVCEDEDEDMGLFSVPHQDFAHPLSKIGV